MTARRQVRGGHALRGWHSAHAGFDCCDGRRLLTEDENVRGLWHLRGVHRMGCPNRRTALELARQVRQ